jgi:hypothetical protein
MNNLKSTTKLVKAILEKDEKARNSDNYLYARVLSTIAKERQFELSNVSVINFLKMMDAWNFPPFESVRRTRQKLQASYPELRGNTLVGAYRAVKEEEYKDYARSVIQ